MNWSPNSIFFTCIAKHTTILAEFSSRNADFSDLAQKCLDRTPAFHSVFSHTVDGKTYMFFIDDPFVYFGIFDESLEKPKCLLFLKNVKDAFTGMIDKLSYASTMNLNSHCLQEEFSPVFRNLVDSKSEPSEDDEADDVSDDDVSSGYRGVWNKQVMVLLSMDLVICAGLFVLWLLVCNGFRCVAN